jgi:hypothetical protein
MIASRTFFHKRFLPLIWMVVFTAAMLFGEVLPPPRFSAERGFYKKPFALTITTEENHAFIRYTLDGSDPRFSNNGITAASSITVLVNPEDTTGRDTAPGFIVRAAACEADTHFSAVITHTYLFVEKAGQLSPDGRKPGPQWPEPNSTAQRMDYGLDSDVLTDPRYQGKLTEALLSIPTVSLVTDLNNLFDRKIGIYVNALQHGDEWERPASVELLNPDGTAGFQIDAGLRIRGGYSRNNSYPKHAFRLFFREKYGAPKLQYPLFGDEGVDEFDKLDLRTSQNYAWSNFDFQGVFNIMIRDVYSRDLQRDMGQPYTRSRFYHLYINGTYWGLFQSQERPEARYAASYFGGSSDDYDVVKVAPETGMSIEATDGNLDTWEAVWNLCEKGFADQENYCRLLGLEPDGKRDPDLPKLIDVDNLIDYMLIIFQTGNFDAPTTKFGSNKAPNNFYAIYNRVNPDGFKFFAHDAEHTLFTSPYASPGIGLYENRVNIGDLTDGYKMTVTAFNKFHPQWLHYRLIANKDYRVRFADRVYKHFFNGGAMTPEPNINRFMARAEEIDMAIVAESARWGDAQVARPRTKHDDWLPQIDNVVDNFFPYRNDIVLNQLKEAGLYPNLEPPRFYRDAVELTGAAIQVESGFKLTLQNPNASGRIYYTIDGTDPRQMDGIPSNLALTATDTGFVEILQTARVKARILNGDTWSPLHEITVSVPDDLSGLKVTEIHYHPLDEGNINGREFEFIELKNIGGAPLNLTDAAFVNGIDFTFPAGTLLEAGAFVVLGSNRQQFNNRYGFYPFGEYTGQLENNGERIVLLNASGDTVVNIRYNDKSPWPEEPDSLGYSLVPTEYNPTGNPNDPANWRASYLINGSPGKDDDGMTSVWTMEKPAGRYALGQNYPNPFNPETVVSYTLARQERVSLVIYNASGRKIRTLSDQVQAAGRHEIVWDSRDDTGWKVPSGLYICSLQAGSFTWSVKMMLLK